MADAQARKLPVRHRETTTTDETTFTLTLDTDLRDRFVAEADATLRHADDVLRDLMRDFVARRHAARGDEVAAEVARAVQEADDPGTRRVPHRDARARLEQQRDAMRSR